MYKKRFQKIFTICLLSFLLLGSFFVLYMYNKSLSTSFKDNDYAVLDEILSKEIALFREQFNSRRMTLDVVSYMISELYVDDTSWNTIHKNIEKLTSVEFFEDIAILDLQGNMIFSQNDVSVNVSEREYFQRILAGEDFVISERMKSKQNGKPITVFAVPVKIDGNLRFVVRGRYYISDFISSRSFIAAFDNRAQVDIYDPKGRCIFSSQKDFYDFYTDVFERISTNDVRFLNESSLEKCIENLRNGKRSLLFYKKAGEDIVVFSAPFNMFNWMISIRVPKSVLERQTLVLEKNSQRFIGIIAIFLVSLIILFCYMQYNFSSKMYKTAYYDSLTNIPNLSKFKEEMRQNLHKRKKESFLITKFDIYNFKIINEMFGHQIGDRILLCVAKSLLRLQKMTSDTSDFLFARVQNDEFIVLIPYEEKEEFECLHQAFMSLMKKETYFIRNYKLVFNWGRYYIDKGESDCNEILEKVYLSHRIAKSTKATHMCEYNEDFKKQVLIDNELESRQEAALQNKEFKLYLQPKYQLENEELIGAEALVRWIDEAGNFYSPGQFIPLFEKNGFVLNLDFYMLEEVCKTIKNWMEFDLTIIPVSVNFSRLHLEDDTFVSKINEIVDSYEIPRRFIEIELTETSIYKNEDLVVAVLDKIHEEGYIVSIDDFGSGYSSLGLLKNMHVDVLKIDRSFFDSTRFPEKASTIIASVFSMAKKLRMTTVAEGIETKEQVDLLREYGCNIVQGFYYARPMSLDDFNFNYFALHNKKKIMQK